jgi:maleylpyruvate isomerase
VHGSEVAAAIAASQNDIARRLVALSDDELRAPSRLPDWSRLTVVCHIRFGAEAIDRMVRAALRGEPSLFYPGGRAATRPGTLLPAEGESPQDVVASFVANCDRLNDALAMVQDWTIVHHEPEGQADLGPQTIYQLAVLRLTEVDVHAVDLDIGIERWSDTFAAVGLPLRIDRLSKRLANTPEAASPRPTGSWLLRASEGPAYLVTSSADAVTTRPATADERADGTIDASSRDLIALMLGRGFEADVVFSNDFARSFTEAFPGP